MKHPILSLKVISKHEQTILEVKDSGRGIDPKDIPRIFDKGFTSTTKHQDHAATGMGLYLAKKAAKSLFIHIDVQSKLGTGTTFTLTFPKRNEFVTYHKHVTKLSHAFIICSVNRRKRTQSLL